MESIVCPKCGEVVSFEYYFGHYKCICGWKDDTRKKERERRLFNNCECKDGIVKKRKTVFLAKKVWEDFLDGRGKILETLEAGELHYRFGDCPEKYVVEVEMSEVLPVPDIEKGAPFEP